MLTDRPQNVDADFIVEPLLFVQIRFREVDKRRRVHVDVVEASVDRLAGQGLHGLQLGLTVGGKLLRVDLEVIALNEYRTAEAFAKRGREHHGHILTGPLLGVSNLRAGDLEKERAGLELYRRPKDRARGVIRHAAHVDGRHREPAHLAATPRDVQIVN